MDKRRAKGGAVALVVVDGSAALWCRSKGVVFRLHFILYASTNQRGRDEDEAR